MTGLLCHIGNWESQQLREGAVTAFCEMHPTKRVSLCHLSRQKRIKSLRRLPFVPRAAPVLNRWLACKFRGNLLPAAVFKLQGNAGSF